MAATIARREIRHDGAAYSLFLVNGVVAGMRRRVDMTGGRQHWRTVAEGTPKWRTVATAYANGRQE